MTALTVEQALENIYTSLHNGNEDIDTHIRQLKESLPPDAQGAVRFDPARLPQNNRQGRKLMQSYFKKRGITVEFSGV
ncbi:MAG: hypothetical protein HYS17_11750 [Micavibrio aeruginosavorus]|uniref:Uncharacterized protein n=1 Tax=Micavibrio aeruginosavorus TaxID=349221 RepID=A0A7T5R2B3_9BACT|nr:MAG: hypothetical protein HYS17_11750 [Micavibrio aeruginosavorus]